MATTWPKKRAIVTAAYQYAQGAVTVEALCQAVGFSRQAYYQARQREAQKAAEVAIVLSLVRMVRARHPHMGTRKLLRQIRPMLAQEGLRIGRDRLFALLKREGLLVPWAKSRRRTTWGGRYRYPNLVAGLEVSRPNQVWAVDITYLQTADGGFLYLFIVMDLYSRTLVGWTLAGTLEAQHAIQALKNALAFAHTPVAGLIHHSDHGVQYTSKTYHTLLAEHGICASMGMVGNAYENAYAERMLGTLKQEYLVEGLWSSFKQAERVVSQAIRFYNTERPHTALDWSTPQEVYTHQLAAEPVKVKEVVACL